jgi:hypothetical protein
MLENRFHTIRRNYRSWAGFKVAFCWIPYCIKKISEKCRMQKPLRILSLPLPEREDIVEAGEKFLLVILGAKHRNTLDELLFCKYSEKISGPTRQAVKAEALGPTSDAALQHTMDVF